MARKQRDSKRTSLADVAREAGVSLATASRVLSGSPYYVTDATRSRVIEAAERLSYDPNTLARALAAGRSKIVGVLIGRITDPYYSEVVEGVEDKARRGGYLTIVCNTGWSATAELTYLRWLRNYHAAGVVFASGVYEDEAAREVSEEAARLIQAGVKVVGVAERDLGAVPLITIDNAPAMAELTIQMIGSGHKRIGYVGAPVGFSTGDRRRTGFHQAMADAALEPAFDYDGDFRRSDGQQLAIRLLQAGPLPDAIICDSDEAALGILVALTRAGVSIPDDLSIAGFDDTGDAELMGLTTVNVPTFDLGAAAADFVSRESDGPPSQHVYLPFRIVQRNTTREHRGTFVPQPAEPEFD